MRVIVDTCIWSLALRRKNETSASEVDALNELIIEGRVQMMGAIRQEILSGIKIESQFKRLRNTLRAFPDWIHSSEDYELAASFYTKCRSNGIQGSNTDFLICATAVRHGMYIFTTDNDFLFFREHTGISLYPPPPIRQS